MFSQGLYITVLKQSNHFDVRNNKIREKGLDNYTQSTLALFASHSPCTLKMKSLNLKSE